MGAFDSPFGALRMPSSTMTVRVSREDDEHGGSYAAPVTISNVRFEEACERRAASGTGAQRGYLVADDVKGLIFIDAAASAGAFSIPTGSLVSVDGGEPMEVVRSNRFEDFAGRTHHWEVEVR